MLWHVSPCIEPQNGNPGTVMQRLHSLLAAVPLRPARTTPYKLPRFIASISHVKISVKRHLIKLLLNYLRATTKVEEVSINIAKDEP